MQELTGARYPVLADPELAAASAYGIYNLLGDGVAAPATLIIVGRQIAASYVGRDIADRVPAPAILQTLRELRGTAPAEGVAS